MLHKLILIHRKWRLKRGKCRTVPIYKGMRLYWAEELLNNPTPRVYEIVDYRPHWLHKKHMWVIHDSVLDFESNLYPDDVQHWVTTNYFKVCYWR